MKVTAMSTAFPVTPQPIRPITGTLTRFAPAPTGLLHLGHVLNALYVWNTARLIGCRVMLRIEDHDRERSRPEFERAILDDLDWLGFVADVHPAAAFRSGRCEGRQSDREEVYRSALQQLVRENVVYACECTRRALTAAPGLEQGRELRYPGNCRDKRLPLIDGYGWRVRLGDSVERFDDALLGPQSQRPAAQCGDLLIRDRLGNWTYQFSAAVDDLWQGVDLVIRGIDLLESTGRQIQLARLLGRTVPATFMHHPLIMRTGDQKLSKSDGDTGVRALAAAGWTRDRILAEAVRLPAVQVARENDPQ
jgi:glutamyl-tRNA synthetase/glutamyl-Q tRNA(Asp) synthetase